MKIKIATWPWVPLGLIFAAALPASAQGPAERVPVECEIDLSVLPGVPAEFSGSSFVADFGELNCPGSSPGQPLQLRCTEQLDGWDGGRISTRDFRCELSDKDCPGVTTPNTADADNRTLTINTDGLVELFCQRNVVQ